MHFIASLSFKSPSTDKKIHSVFCDLVLEFAQATPRGPRFDKLDTCHNFQKLIIDYHKFIFFYRHWCRLLPWVVLTFGCFGLYVRGWECEGGKGGGAGEGDPKLWRIVLFQRRQRFVLVWRVRSWRRAFCVLWSPSGGKRGREAFFFSDSLFPGYGQWTVCPWYGVSFALVSVPHPLLWVRSGVSFPPAFVPTQVARSGMLADYPNQPRTHNDCNPFLPGENVWPKELQ